jgi:hypothetical protein
MELHVRRSNGEEQRITLPPVALNADRLLSGDRAAVLTEDSELSPTEIALCRCYPK